MRGEFRRRIGDRRWLVASTARPHWSAPGLEVPRLARRRLRAPDRIIDPRRSPSALAPASPLHHAAASKGRGAALRLRARQTSAPSPCPPPCCPRWLRRWDLLRPVQRLGRRRGDSTPLRWPKAPPPRDLVLCWNLPSNASYKLSRAGPRLCANAHGRRPGGPVNQKLLYNRNARIQTGRSDAFRNIVNAVMSKTLKCGTFLFGAEQGWIYEANMDL